MTSYPALFSAIEETPKGKGNILIVDDMPANLRLLSSMLTTRGYKVRGVVNGPMALTAARAASPDLILLDITMPEMDGFEVCEQLKADPTTSDIPVIFISALDSTEDKVKAFTVGGVDYITKPFQVEEVLARVETHLTLRNIQKQLERVNEELEKRVTERTVELVELNAALERFVPKEFVRFLGKQSILEVKLGDQVQREMTILVSDVRDFTTLSERMMPQESFNFLNAYMNRMGPIIRQHHGFVDQYQGDGLMALFPEGVDDGLNSAIDMLREVSRFNEDMQKRNYPPVGIGVGVHVGSLMMGIIGEEQRVEGTVISDDVNLGYRIESLTKLYGVPIVISEQALRQLSDPGRFETRYLDRVQVKGKSEPVSVYEVLDGESDSEAELKRMTRSEFESGLDLYYERRFAEASVKFHKVLEKNPEDRAARMYLHRSAHFMVNGVPSNWEGVETLTEK